MVILHTEPLPHHLQLKEMFCSVISLRLRTAIFRASLCSFTCAHALRHLSLRKKRQRREDVVLKSPGSWGGEGVENRWKETERRLEGGDGGERKRKHQEIFSKTMRLQLTATARCRSTTFLIGQVHAGAATSCHPTQNQYLEEIYRVHVH